MIRKLLSRAILYDNDGVPGGTPAPTPNDGGTPAPADTGPPADGGTPAPTPNDGGTPAPESGTVPLKALTETQRKLRETREQLAFLQGMQAAAPAPAAPTAPAPATPAGPPVAPRIEDFENLDDFNAADRQYIIDTAEYNALEKLERGITQRTQQANVEQQTRTFNERLNKAAELDPELPVIASTFHLPGPNHIPLSGPMQDAIRESDVGPQLLRYFANNKAEATRLSALSPVSALREIGRVEAAIINKPTPPVKHVTSAPEPVKSVGSGPAPDTDDEALEGTAYLTRYRERQLALRRGRSRGD